MNSYEYGELYLGKMEEFDIKISPKMMERFMEITGDINPLHCDDGFANLHGYPSKVVYGMMTASFLSTLAGVYLPGKKSLIQSVEVKFVKPVYVGDELHVLGMVEELNDTVQQIVLKVDIKRRSGEKVLRAKMKVGILNE